MALMDEIEFRVYRSHLKIPLIFLVPLLCICSAYVLVYFYVNSNDFRYRLEELLHRSLDGHFKSSRFVVHPSLTRVEIYGFRLLDPDQNEVVEARKIDARINPLLLLTNRLQFEHGIAHDARVQLIFRKNEQMNLLRALGADSRQSAQNKDRDDREASLAVGFANLRLENSEFYFQHEHFDFTIPAITIPQASIFIEPTNLIMAVDSLDVPQVFFRFSPELFTFDADYGDLAFVAENFSIRQWQWFNDGYVVDHVSTDIEGYRLEASGRMAFPSQSDRDDGATMIYDAQGSIKASYWSDFPQYFLRDNLHFEMPKFDIAVQGSLSEIDGGFSLYASVLEVAGLFFENLQGDFRLQNRFITVENAAVDSHGGSAAIDYAYFNFFEAEYGGLFQFIDVDPASVLDDLDIDLNWLAGSASGGIAVVGKVPMLRPYHVIDNPRPWLRYATSRYVDMILTHPFRLRRANRELFPVDEVEMTPQSVIRVDKERVNIPNAQLRVGADRYGLENFQLHYPSMVVETDANKQPAKVHIDIKDISSYAAGYGFDLLSSGPLTLHASLQGYLGVPQIEGQVHLDSLQWQLDQYAIEAESLAAQIQTTKEGDIIISSMAIDSPLAAIETSGRIGYWQPLSTAQRKGPERTILPQPRKHQSLALNSTVRSFDLVALNHLVGDFLEIKGRANAMLNIDGTIAHPIIQFATKANNFVMRGQPIAEIIMDGQLTPDALGVENLVVDAGLAGEFRGQGRYGFDQRFDFKLTGDGLELAHFKEFERLNIPISGRGDIVFNGTGSLRNPILSGNGRFRELGYLEHPIGSGAFVAHTLDNILYLEGAVLPWSSFSVEIPLHSTAPYYARFDMRDLDIIRAIPQLGQITEMDKTHLTGKTEVYFEKDFSRYQVLVDLTSVELHWLGQIIRNQKPIRLGWNNGEMLQLDDVTIGTGGRYVRVNGAILWQASPFFDLAVDGELDMALINSARILVPDIIPDFIMDFQGHVLIDAAMRGNAESLSTDGEIDIGHTEFTIRQLHEPVRINSGKILFDRNGMVVLPQTPLTGEMMGGVMRLNGQIDYPPEQPVSMDLQFWSHNMSYRIPDFANVSFDTEGRLQATDVTRFDQWLVSGNFNILDGLFYRNFNFLQEQITGRVIGAFNRRAERYDASLFEQIPILNDIRFDAFVRARDGFRIRNHIDRLELDLELRVDLHVLNTLADPTVNGDIEVIAGDLIFQGEVFEVRSGTVRYTEDLDNPWVDIIAGVDIRGTCQDADLVDEINPSMSLQANIDLQEQRYYHIVLNVQGHLNNLDITFESQPYADQRDILSLLLTGCTVDQLTASSASRPTLEIALGPLLGRLEREIQEVVKVEEFTIMPGVERTQVRISDTLTRRLSWRFQLDTGFGESSGGQYSQLEYKLSDKWSAELSERSRTDTNTFFMDLKLKYRLALD